jgi:hypothetical protein
LHTWITEERMGKGSIELASSSLASIHLTAYWTLTALKSSKASFFISCVPLEINRSFVRRSKGIAFFLEFHRSIEIFSFCYWSIEIVFGVHHLEITLKIGMHFFRFKSFWWFWVNWLSSVPIIFNPIIIIAEFLNSVGWCFY